MGEQTANSACKSMGEHAANSACKSMGEHAANSSEEAVLMLCLHSMSVSNDREHDMSRGDHTAGM